MKIVSAVLIPSLFWFKLFLMSAIKEIKRAEVLGYCMGVKRAVDSALKAAENNPGKKIFTFGPLIHNNETIALLKSKNIKTIEPAFFKAGPEYENSIIVIRAHGITPAVLEQIKACGAEVADATCPRVISSQRCAKKYAESHTVILAGDKNHGELIGIAGHAGSVPGSVCIILESAEEAEKAQLETARPAVLIAQTTIKQSEYDAIAAILKKRLNGRLTVINTICPATAERQAALKKLTKETEAVLIVGGKNSANTRRLLQTAVESGKPAWLTENQHGIPQEIYSYASVGIAAGASTPSFVIDEVEKKLKS